VDYRDRSEVFFVNDLLEVRSTLLLLDGAHLHQVRESDITLIFHREDARLVSDLRSKSESVSCCRHANNLRFGGFDLGLFYLLDFISEPSGAHESANLDRPNHVLFTRGNHVTGDTHR
jgi:hypothetical protein